MAKAELLEQAKQLGLDVSAKNTVAEIEAAIKSAASTAQTESGTEEVEADKPLAKAGKRSAKGVAEAEEKAEKVEQQHHRTEAGDSKEAKPKHAVKPARPKHERKGKNYKEAIKLVDKTKLYSLKEALALAQATSKVKFDASVELHINLAVDPKQADQNVRGNLVLPHGTGKTVKIAVFDDAKVNGADVSGIETLTKQLEKGEINFDVLVASPANMAKLGKYARLLGPRGLMPNPKSGTVTADLNKAVAEAKAGKIDYRVDSTGIVHAAIGKVSFKPDQLLLNADALLSNIRAAKPASVKGNYVQSIYVATTMGPSIGVATSA